MKMKGWLAALLLHTAWAQATLAQSPLPDLIGSRDITISAGQWPPYLAEELKHQGMIAHMIRDIFADEGYRVRFVFLPWPRAYLEAAQARHQATAVWMHKDERTADFLYSEPVLQEQHVFFHLKQTPFEWQTLEDLRGLILGGVHEFSYGPDFDRALEEGVFQIERVSDDRQNFHKLLRERVAVYPQEINVGYSALWRDFSVEDASKITHHTKPLLNNLSYVLFPIRGQHSEALRARFNARLQAYRDSGRYDTYFQRLREGYYWGERLQEYVAPDAGILVPAPAP